MVGKYHPEGCVQKPQVTCIIVHVDFAVIVEWSCNHCVKQYLFHIMSGKHCYNYYDAFGLLAEVGWIYLFVCSFVCLSELIEHLTQSFLRLRFLAVRFHLQWNNVKSSPEPIN